MESLIKFVPEQLIILVVALYVVGVFLKKTPRVKDWCIPWALMILGVIFSIAICGLTATSILQGIICSFVAVAVNQVYKQSILKR